ncbi:MAG: alpha/beta hydrolase [Proteobacteria bacterium]|jgi:pimeloyl-ACP methyl ester carboxylesterase|nr:alpha/beta hydrolase [Litorivicinus sp.]MDA0894976.1 alpha/beta hydrolase [Pseudomonadota bacterium]
MLKPFRASDGTLLHYFDHGHGRLVIFQHGFAMDHRQILETWPDLQDSRLVCLETRGHGFSELGPSQELSFQRAVMDLHELIDHLGEDPQIMGGTSLGAALVMELSQQIAIPHLVLSRPAFGVDQNTDHFAVFRALQTIIRTQPQSQWLTELMDEPRFQALKATAPRNQETYQRLLDHPRLNDLMIWMDALESEALTLSASDLQQFKGRIDVIGQHQDALHPMHLAQHLATLYPNAKLHEIASGFASETEYQESLRRTLAEILSSS